MSAIELSRGYKDAAFTSAVFSSVLNLGKYSSISMSLAGGALGATASFVDSFIYPNLIEPALKNKSFCEGEVQNDVAKLSFRIFVVLTVVSMGARLFDLNIRIKYLVLAGLFKIFVYALFRAVSAICKIPSGMIFCRDWLIGDCDALKAIHYFMLV